MAKAHFVVMINADRAPVLLGPMSETMRMQHMRELAGRYEHCALHAMDVNARSGDRVSVEVKRFEREG